MKLLLIVVVFVLHESIECRVIKDKRYNIWKAKDEYADNVKNNNQPGLHDELTAPDLIEIGIPHDNVPLYNIGIHHDVPLYNIGIHHDVPLYNIGIHHDVPLYNIGIHHDLPFYYPGIHQVDNERDAKLSCPECGIHKTNKRYFKTGGSMTQQKRGYKPFIFKPRPETPRIPANYYDKFFKDVSISQ